MKRIIKAVVYTFALVTSKTALSMPTIEFDMLETNSTNSTQFPGCLNISSNDWCNDVWAPANNLDQYLNSTELLACYSSQDCKTGVLEGLLISDILMGIFGILICAYSDWKITHRGIKMAITSLGSALFFAGIPGGLTGFCPIIISGKNLEIEPPLAAPIQKNATYVTIAGGLIGFAGALFCKAARQRLPTGPAPRPSPVISH